tara:strand:+ start:1273 stop:1749 length:477 start_codon:yes stop_codon:yes gene_type:complete
MKKKILVNYFSDSKKWPPRMAKIRILTNKTLKKMYQHFNKNYSYHINLILSDKYLLRQLNKNYKKVSSDTDVLTFVNTNINKDLGKILYCDIFFSIDTIENFIKKNKINLYDHFNHLLIHSFLHINGYQHKKINDFKKMKNIEIKVLKNLNIKNPYVN